MPITDLVPWRRGEKKIQVRRDVSEPFYGTPFYEMRERMNDMFDRFFNEFSLEPFGFWVDGGAFQPRVDVKETDNDITVSAELPGMDDNDIDVSLIHDELTISGEKKGEVEEKGKHYSRTERSYGSFQRVLRLPCEVEQDKIEATFKNGVLTINLPKSPDAIKRTKKIAIKSG